MLKTLACILALVSSAAMADGVPLITAGPPLAAADTARNLSATKMPNFVTLHPIVLNKAAFGANVLTVVVDGKEHRFGGAMMALRPPVPKAVTEHQPETISWSGTEPGGGTLVLSKDIETGGLLGTMFLPPSRIFHIATPPKGTPVLIESDANVAPAINYVKPLPPIAPMKGSLR